MKEVNLKVSPITCMGCVNEIKSVLNVDGIKSVDAKARDENVRVMYDESKISVDEIKELIKKTGREVI